MSGKGGDKLLNEENEEDGADGGQDEIMDQEQGLEFEGLSIAHPLATTENDGVVEDGEDEGFFQCRQWSPPSGKPEIIGRVADHDFEGLAEIWPDGHAEGPIESRDGERLPQRSRCWSGHFALL